MADYTLLVRRNYDDAAKGELRLIEDFSFSYSLSGFGELRATFALDDPVGDALGWTVPSRYNVSLRRNGKPVWNGFIWSRHVDPMARTVEIAANEWGSILKWLVFDTDHDYDSDLQTELNALMSEVDVFFGGVAMGGIIADPAGSLSHAIVGTFTEADHPDFLAAWDQLSTGAGGGFEYRWTFCETNVAHSLYVVAGLPLGKAKLAANQVVFDWYVSGGGNLATLEWDNVSTANQVYAYNSFGDRVAREIHAFPAPPPDPPFSMRASFTYPELDDDQIDGKGWQTMDAGHGGDGLFANYTATIVNPAAVFTDDTYLGGCPPAITHAFPGEVGDWTRLIIGAQPGVIYADEQARIVSKAVEVARDGTETITLGLTNGG